jgi:hypothetical protein
MSHDGGPPRKKTSTLTIVLAILGGGLLLFFVAVGVAIYALVSSPKGRAIVGVMGEAVKISARAQKAPGTAELRAMGCKQAMVMDIDDLGKMMAPLDAAPPPRQEALFGEMVVCSAGPFHTPPSCENVAATYVSAVGPRQKSFVVSVQRTGKRDCTILYDSSGQKVRSLDPQATPSVPED